MGKGLVVGVGINDGEPVREYVFENGKYKLVWICSFYRRWSDMLTRCYSEKYKIRQPTYVGCSVCEEWVVFSNFKSWMETQDYEGKHLDKDLLVCNNKVYSPETCCFVTKEVNSFLIKRQNHRGNYPIGVNKHYSGFYYARISSKNHTMKHLGSFNNPLKAHRAWQLAKIERAEVLKKEQTNIRIIAGLQRIINKIQNDYDNNLETVDF